MPTWPRTLSISFLESKPTPALNTISTFSISSMFLEGSPLISTRSACLPAAIPRAVLRGDLNGLDGSESRLDEQLDFALIAEAGEDAAVAGRIGPGEEQASRFGEGHLKIHFFAHQRRHGRIQRNSGPRGQ